MRRSVSFIPVNFVYLHIHRWRRQSSIFILFLLCACSTPISHDPSTSKDRFSSADKNKNIWTWIPVPETICRDGSSTGFGVRLQEDAEGVMLFFQGGGACYDKQSCSLNAKGRVAGSHYSFKEFSNWSRLWGQRGIFNVKNQRNPVRYWHHVYIPYCTADLFAGRRKDVIIENLDSPQQFNGYQNTVSFLSIISPFFSKTSNVLVAGASSGGLGLMFNYDHIAEAFTPRPVNALVDAAPFLISKKVNASCFQQKIISTFDLQLPEDCAACSRYSEGGLVALYQYLGNRYPRAQFGLTSAESDIAGTLLMNKESSLCGGEAINLWGYRNGLLTLRQQELEATSNWSTFFWKGIEHTAIQNDQLFYRNKASGLSIADWLRSYLKGNTTHAGP